MSNLWENFNKTKSPLPLHRTQDTGSYVSVSLSFRKRTLVEEVTLVYFKSSNTLMIHFHNESLWSSRICKLLTIWYERRVLFVRWFCRLTSYSLDIQFYYVVVYSVGVVNRVIKDDLHTRRIGLKTE